MLFGCIAVSEATARGATDADALAAARRPRRQAYREICATLDAENYPHLLRVWNYLPDINRDSHGTERYRQFNSARQHALRDERPARSRGNVPGRVRARRGPRQSAGGVLPGRAHARRRSSRIRAR